MDKEKTYILPIGFTGVALSTFSFHQQMKDQIKKEIREELTNELYVKLYDRLKTELIINMREGENHRLETWIMLDGKN